MKKAKGKGNPKYRRGRALEWATAKLLRKAGYSTIRASGSHGLGDLVVFRTPADAMDLMKPITIQDMDAALPDWSIVHDRNLVLESFLYGRKKTLPRGAEHTLHMTPATVWLIQCKSEQPKKGKKK